VWQVDSGGGHKLGLLQLHAAANQIRDMGRKNTQADASHQPKTLFSKVHVPQHSVTEGLKDRQLLWQLKAATQSDL